MRKLGFDNDKYLRMQSEHIKERITTLFIYTFWCTHPRQTTYAIISLIAILTDFQFEILEQLDTWTYRGIIMNRKNNLCIGEQVLYLHTCGRNSFEIIDMYNIKTATFCDKLFEYFYNFDIIRIIIYIRRIMRTGAQMDFK